MSPLAKFRLRGILKYLILVSERDSFKCFIFFQFILLFPIILGSYIFISLCHFISYLLFSSFIFVFYLLNVFNCVFEVQESLFQSTCQVFIGL